MIDLARESAISLKEAARLVPPARDGHRCHLSTLLRWILQGCRSPTGEVVRLEALRLGGKWITSREALQRFAERLTPHLEEAAPAPRSAQARSRASLHAEAELERHGV
jgi:hypothetical protein